MRLAIRKKIGRLKHYEKVTRFEIHCRGQLCPRLEAVSEDNIEFVPDFVRIQIPSSSPN